MVHAEEQGQQRAAVRLTTALNRHGRPLLIALIVLLALILIAVTVNEVVKSRAARSLERLRTVLQTIESTDPADDPARSSAIDAADNLAAQFPRTYAAQRAAYEAGLLEIAAQRWAEAEERLSTFSQTYKSSYLRPSALMGAAIAAETEGNQAGAADYLAQIVEIPERTAHTTRALFALGRIAEQGGNTDEALARYNELVDRYPTSGWTSLARNRIIALEIGRS